ncbi:MAG: RND transporter, partial [Gammaproteobacteria bacterium]|nr:RND transporter [Gammaproteobacteria bacterium]
TPLRPGAFVRIELDDRLYSGVAAIPETALYGEDRVFVVENGLLRSRRVELHGYDGELMLLGKARENALADGEQVVITQLREAGENARAVVVE